ncbi:MAG: hypothetical protein OXI69_17500 [Acidobacteriota bacterium]|nr:hypothetical protein [Acidobacteriota bacterium]
MGGDPTRERGRPARMHSHSVPLSFPAIQHPAAQSHDPEPSRAPHRISLRLRLGFCDSPSRGE